MTPFTESIIEQAAIDWLTGQGYDYAFGPKIAFDGSICTAAKLWDSLLPKLIRCEVRVRIAD